MSERKPILEYIAAHITDDELPADFSLPKDDSDSVRVRFADGALDGIGIYHMRQPEITDEMLQLIAEAFRFIGNIPKAMQHLKALFQKIPPLGAIDAIQQYILEHTDVIDADSVLNLAVQGLFGFDIDMVKLGMLLLEMLAEPNENLKDVIRTLGRSDEFTIFAVFNMHTWEDGNAEIFRLAQCVHGWGRIHAVARLNPDTQEIRDWLLREGIENNILKEYSAPDVYEKTDIPALLQQEISGAQLDQIAAVLNTMFNEGPVPGISGLPEAEASAVLGDFLRQAKAHPLTADICVLVRRISEDARFSVHADACAEIQNREAYQSLTDD